MGAPGTLIPADALSGKDTPLKSYNPQPGRLPNLQTTTDTKVSSTQPGQNSVGGYNLSLSTTSWKPQSLLSSSDGSANDGVGTSGLHDNVPSANQVDHSLSQAIGSSIYKGGRGPNLAGDGVRINQNVIPYSPKSAEDPKNLFAELNPFQIKGSGKTVVQNDLPNEVGKMQFSKSNIVSGRPPAPLMWKNRQAWNELPKENEYGFQEGSFVKNNQGANKGNALSVVSRSSKPPSKAPKFPEKSFDNPADKRDSMRSNNFKLASDESGPRQLPFGKDFRFNDSETYLREDGDIIKNEEPNLEDHGNITTRLHEDKKNLQDRLSVTNMKMMKTEGASCSLDLGASYVDTEIDDVGECEIVWEDLVLGERIGLGNTSTSYFCRFSSVQTSLMFCMSVLAYVFSLCTFPLSELLCRHEKFCMFTYLPLIAPP